VCIPPFPLFCFSITIAAVKNIYDKYSETNGTFQRKTRSDKFRIDEDALANKKRVQPRSRLGRFASVYTTTATAVSTATGTGTTTPKSAKKSKTTTATAATTATAVTTAVATAIATAATTATDTATATITDEEAKNNEATAIAMLIYQNHNNKMNNNNNNANNANASGVSGVLVSEPPIASDYCNVRAV